MRASSLLLAAASLTALVAALASCDTSPAAPVDGGAEGEGEAGEGEGEGESEGEAAEGEGEGEGEGAAGEGEGEGEGAVRTPPPIPGYSMGACPVMTGGSTSDTAVIDDFVSSGDTRQLRLLVPDSYDGTQPYPVMFAWHWLNADSASFVRDGELETAIQQFPMIVVLPDKLRNGAGNKVYQLDWPFAEAWGQPKELTYFDDLLSCVNANFNIDPQRIYGVGVSAGGLWVSFLSTTDRANHFAAVESLSGGLGALEVNGTGWHMDYAPQPNKFPAIVLWGGDHDWLGISFKEASERYRDALVGDGHFVVQCVHDQGHAVPPIDAPPGQTKFTFLWQFLFDHPMTVPGGASPWHASGLPSSAPSWCQLLD